MPGRLIPRINRRCTLTARGECVYPKLRGRVGVLVRVTYRGEYRIQWDGHHMAGETFHPNCIEVETWSG